MGLVERFRGGANTILKGVRNTIYLFTAMSILGISACPTPFQNKPPTASLILSNLSGKAPLETRIQLDGEDPDGKEDIKEYKLLIDREGTSKDETIISKTPIDIMRTFSNAETIKVFGYVTDSGELTSEKESEIIVSQPDPFQNKPPTASLILSNLSGKAPLETRLQLDGEDPDGKSDIKEYRLTIDIGDDGTIEETIPPQKTPINIIRTFTTPGIVKIDGYVKDSGNLTATDSKTIEILQPDTTPYISQTVQPAQSTNNVGIKYDANLSNISQATLNVYHDNSQTPLLTRQITTPTYTETFNFPDIIKGDYKFVIQNSDSSASDTDEITIQNFSPSVDLSGVDANFNEEGTITLSTSTNLPMPSDPNPEDNPVRYTQVRTLPSGDWKSFNGTLEIKGEKDIYGKYQLEFQFGSSSGGTGTAILDGEIYNLFDFSGQLQDNETDTGNQGLIKLFDVSNNPPTLLGSTNTDQNGYFTIQADSPASEISLEARILDSSNSNSPTSYVRKLKFSSDTSGIITKAIPSNDLRANGIIDGTYNGVYLTAEQAFRQHMRETNISTLKISDGEIGLRKFDLNLLNNGGVEIVSDNPLNSSRGSFTSTEQDFIKNKVLDVNDIRSYIEGRTINLFSQKHYSFINGTIIPDDGWEIVVPRDINGGLTSTFGERGYIKGVVIYLGLVNNAVISHEFGHAFGLNHAYTLDGYQTIMVASGIHITTPGFADKKAAHIVYEETYPARTTLDSVLSLSFSDGSQN